MTELILILIALIAGLAAAVHFGPKARREQRRADGLHERAERLSQELRAAEQCVGYVTSTVLPAAATAAHSGQEHRVDFVLPPQLVGTPLAGALGTMADHLQSVIVQVGQQAQAVSMQQVTQVRLEAERQIAHVRQEAVDVARAAVRGFASSTVQRASKLSSTISAGVRRHVSDEAYATLVEIDHLAQQMLLAASGYAVLGGDRLSRRWPVTTLTDIVRTAMGRVEGYQRVQHTDMEFLAVESRAVEAVVHSLAVLLDNALRYSPPNARVHVSLEHGANAAFLVVDDAGLRMEDERLTWAREVMSGKQRDDITQLGAYPQTGLRVASVLANQYGFRIELAAPNLYGGTRAVIVLPQALLTTPKPPQPAPAQTTPSARLAPAPEAVPLVPAPSTTASGLTVRQRTPRPVTASPAHPGLEVGPGSPGVAAAWMDGARRAWDNHNTPSTDEGR
ncbi:hypothetical protein [Streptomyces sp. JNUCC 63]